MCYSYVLLHLVGRGKLKMSCSGESSCGENHRGDPSDILSRKSAFVEAPPPKVNPWQRNLNAASVLSSKAPLKDTKSNENVPVPVEKSEPKKVNGARRKFIFKIIILRASWRFLRLLVGFLIDTAYDRNCVSVSNLCYNLFVQARIKQMGQPIGQR